MLLVEGDVAPLFLVPLLQVLLFLSQLSPLSLGSLLSLLLLLLLPLLLLLLQLSLPLPLLLLLLLVHRNVASSFSSSWQRCFISFSNSAKRLFSISKSYSSHSFAWSWNIFNHIFHPDCLSILMLFLINTGRIILTILYGIMFITSDWNKLILKNY